MIYLLVWGNWENAPNTYKFQQDELELDEITTDMGYSPSEIQEIGRLEIGGMWKSELGNHLIFRTA